MLIYEKNLVRELRDLWLTTGRYRLDMKSTLAHHLVLNKSCELDHLPALQFGDWVCTYGELRNMIFSMAAELLRLGIRSGDRVMIQLPNSPEYIIAFLGVITMGGIGVPVDYGSGPERLNFVMSQTGAKLLIAPSPVGRLEISMLSIVLNTSVEKISFLFKGERSEEETPNPIPDLDSPAAIIFSSGSTGRPKGVLLRNRHLLATAKNLSCATRMSFCHRELLLSPMSHTDGWQRVASTLLVSGCLIILKGHLTLPLFFESLEKFQIDGFYSPPSFIRYILMDSSERALRSCSRCRTVEVGSASISVAELKKMLLIFFNAKVLVHFGLTESSRATVLDCRENPDKLQTVGRTLPGVEIRISDEYGSQLGVGEVGEIYLRGVQCADSYWGREDLNGVAFLNGWFRSGDFGFLDEEAFLIYKGRRDDLINSGGFHFFPAEVEVELGPVPGLQQYLITGMPDTEAIFEQIPILFGVADGSKSWSNRKFFDFAKYRLASYKIPKRIAIVPEILRTSSGKPDRAGTFSRYRELLL